MAFLKYTQGTVENHELFLECSCNSSEHLVKISYFLDTDERDLYLSVHLSPERNWFKRIWKAIKYIFGHRSVYGDFDEFIFQKEDIKQLSKVLEGYQRVKFGKSIN